MAFGVLPFRFVGCMRRLGEFLCCGGQAFLGPLQILLQKLDASVQGGDLAFSLENIKKIKSRGHYFRVQLPCWLMAKIQNFFYNSNFLTDSFNEFAYSLKVHHHNS